MLAMLPILATMAATLLTGARTATVWGLAIAGGLSLLAVVRARAAGAQLSLPRMWRTLAVVWLAVAVLAPAWWLARAVLHTPAVGEPREELAQLLDQTWQREYDLPLPWVSGTRALAASVAFYASSHPDYWSLWNRAVETPWADSGIVTGEGGVIVCDPADEECQLRAEAWSVDRRIVSVAKSARGFHFEPRSYVIYWIPPLVAAILP